MSRLNLCTALVNKMDQNNKENLEHHGVICVTVARRGSNEIVNRQQGEAIR